MRHVDNRGQVHRTKSSKPLCRCWTNPTKQQSIARGKLKIENFIHRGIRLNSKPNFMRRTAQAVKQALLK